MIRYAGAAMMQAVERMYPVFKVIWENAQAFLKNFPTRTAADRREKLGFLSGLVGDSIANVVTDADLARNLQVDRRDITRAREGARPEIILTLCEKAKIACPKSVQ